MTIFSDLETLISAEVDAHMAEPTRIDRKVKGQYFSRSADLSRDAATVLGVVDFNPTMARPKDMGQYDGYQPELAGDRIHVSYTATLFPTGTIPVAGDEIALLDATRLGFKLRITRVDPDELGRIVCVCVPA